MPKFPRKVRNNLKIGIMVIEFLILTILFNNHTAYSATTTLLELSNTDPVQKSHYTPGPLRFQQPLSHIFNFIQMRTEFKTHLAPIIFRDVKFYNYIIH